MRALRDRGTTIFLTTHYLEEADALCDRLVIMDHGEIVIEGTPRDLKRQVAGESVVLSLRDEDGTGDRAAALLGRSPTCAELGRARATRSGCTSRTAATALPQILRLLDAEQIGVRSMSLSEPTLDDVFLRQTGRSLRDAGSGSDDEGRAA